MKCSKIPISSSQIKAKLLTCFYGTYLACIRLHAFTFVKKRKKEKLFDDHQLEDGRSIGWPK